MSVFVEIKKDFGSFKLDVEFASEGGVLALLGSSGCGKSMTLRAIAGIVRPDAGRIEIDGVTLFDSAKGINLTPQERQVGLLFQNYALFPNMTVEENLLAGAHREKDRTKRSRKVRQALESFYLKGLERHYPAQLSGGQQQRTALARILVSEPRILMLDEPFSALDSYLRWELEQEVMEVIRRFQKPVLLVSHDREEVFRLSDRIAVMNNGRIDAIGGKEEVFSRPVTRQSAILTGCKNISPIRRMGPKSLLATDWGLTLTTENPIPEEAAFVGIRAHDIRPARKNDPNSFRLRVAQRVENPFSQIVMLVKDAGEKGRSGGYSGRGPDLNGGESGTGRSWLRWELAKRDWPEPGDASVLEAEETDGTAAVSLPPEALLLLK